MLSLATLTTRISTQVTALATVTGMADLIAAKGVAKRKPACYIAPGQESAGAASLIGRTSQRIVETFGVWIAVSNGASATGVAAQAELKTLVDSVRAALIGWPPTTGYTPIELVSAGPIQWDDDQTLFWPEIYRTEYYLEN